MRHNSILDGRIAWGRQPRLSEPQFAYRRLSESDIRVGGIGDVIEYSLVYDGRTVFDVALGDVSE